MAADHHAHDHSGYQPGEMDISAHRRRGTASPRSPNGSLIGILIIMALLAIFRTH